MPHSPADAACRLPFGGALPPASAILAGANEATFGAALDAAGAL